MVYKSIVSSARTSSESLRATIPIGICRQLRLAPGDVLDWTVEKKNNKRFIIVRKLE